RATQDGADGADDTGTVFVEDDQNGSYQVRVELVIAPSNQTSAAVGGERSVGARDRPAGVLDAKRNEGGETSRPRAGLELAQRDAAIVGEVRRRHLVDVRLEKALQDAGHGRSSDGCRAELGRLADALHLDGARGHLLDLSEEASQAPRKVDVRVETRSDL